MCDATCCPPEGYCERYLILDAPLPRSSAVQSGGCGRNWRRVGAAINRATLHTDRLRNSFWYGWIGPTVRLSSAGGAIEGTSRSDCLTSAPRAKQSWGPISSAPCQPILPRTPATWRATHAQPTGCDPKDPNLPWPPDEGPAYRPCDIEPKSRDCMVAERPIRSAISVRARMAK
jgi:hypothetical protein